MVFLTASKQFMKVSPAVKELRIILCQTGESSKGVRNFIESKYVSLKQQNPELPILVRECSGVEPKLWVRYELGEERSATLNGLSDQDVATQIQSLSESSGRERTRASARN